MREITKERESERESEREREHSWSALSEWHTGHHPQIKKDLLGSRGVQTVTLVLYSGCSQVRETRIRPQHTPTCNILAQWFENKTKQKIDLNESS